MEALVEFKPLNIHSFFGDYKVVFDLSAFQKINEQLKDTNYFFIIDKNIVNLYSSSFSALKQNPRVLIIEATETNKSLDKFCGYIESLVSMGIQRNHCLIAIGGGIIQDISCFIAATLFRGLNWLFYPTTLLAQADSCIGSKSSINVGKIKNLLGTFTPPNEIIICTTFLQTLKLDELKSGIGEMLKVHAIKGPNAFKEIAPCEICL